MNYREVIRELLTDNDGNYKLGLTNGVTPEDVLQKMGIDPNDKDFYQVCRTELNAVCAIICKEGYYAGGVSRTPTVYFIAKNPSEQRMLVSSRAKNNIGRLALLQLRGSGIVNTKQLKGAQNLLQKLLEDPEQDELDLLEDNSL